MWAGCGRSLDLFCTSKSALRFVQEPRAVQGLVLALSFAGKTLYWASEGSVRRTGNERHWRIRPRDELTALVTSSHLFEEAARRYNIGPIWCIVRDVVVRPTWHIGEVEGRRNATGTIR